ncbi:MAG: hypothetical protein ACK40G_16460 [Cytophagaceae bacterium]
MNKLFKFCVIACFIAFVGPNDTFAQFICPPGCTNPPACDDCDDPSVPFDGGATAIVLGGLAIGANKLLRNRKK